MLSFRQWFDAVPVSALQALGSVPRAERTSIQGVFPP